MKYGIYIALLIVMCILGAYVNISLPYTYEMTLRNLGIYKLSLDDMDAQKFVMMRFGILWIIGMVVLTNGWLRTWFSWVIICLFCHYNAYSLARAHYILFFLILYQVFKDKLTPKGITIIYNTIAVVVLLNIAWMIAQKCGVEFLYFPRAGYAGTCIGVYGNTNNSGALIALGLPVFFRKRWVLGLIPCFIGLWMSNAFVSIIAVACGSIYYLGLIGAKQWIILILMAVMLYAFIGEPVSHFKDGNLRLPYWTKIYAQVSEKPIKGYGLGMFKYIFPKIDMKTYGAGSPQNRWDAPRTFHKAHNDYLEMVFNQGYVGLLLFLGFVFSSIQRFSRQGKSSYIGKISLIGILIAMIVSFGHYMTHSTLILLPLFYMIILTNQTKGVSNEEVTCNCMS